MQEDVQIALIQSATNIVQNGQVAIELKDAAKALLVAAFTKLKTVEFEPEKAG